FQKARHPAGGLHRAGIRRQYAVEDLEQGGFPRAVAADDAEGFAILHPEAETPQGLVAGVEWPAQHNLLETIGGPMVELEGFFETRDLDHCPPPCVPTREGVWPGDLALGSKKITDILLQLAADKKPDQYQHDTTAEDRGEGREIGGAAEDKCVAQRLGGVADRIHGKEWQPALREDTGHVDDGGHPEPEL